MLTDILFGHLRELRIQHRGLYWGRQIEKAQDLSEVRIRTMIKDLVSPCKNT